MPNSIGDSCKSWWHTNGENGYRVPEPASALPGSAIRAHVHRAPTVFPENQLEAILQYAAAHGTEIVQAYSDHGRSGPNVADLTLESRIKQFRSKLLSISPERDVQTGRFRKLWREEAGLHLTGTARFGVKCDGKDRCLWRMRFEIEVQAVVAVLTLVIAVIVTISTWQLLLHTLKLVKSHVVTPADPQVFQGLFGMVLTVLIALEFKHTLLVVKHHRRAIVQVRAVVLIALLALVRRFIILDLCQTSPSVIAALAGAALGARDRIWARPYL
jgi:uncharacterized membrane protein (DUF373 family)